MKITGHQLSKILPGLSYYKNFVNPQEKLKILNQIIQPLPWCNHLRRQQQYYGIKYFQTKVEDKVLQNSQSQSNKDHFQLGLFQFIIDRMIQKGVFDAHYPPNQCLVNKYKKKDYLGLHVEDKECYGPIVAGLSFGDVDYLRLRKVMADDIKSQEQQTKSGIPYETDVNHNSAVLSASEDFYLKMEDCSLYVLKGEARENYKHGISRAIKENKFNISSCDRLEKKIMMVFNISTTRLLHIENSMRFDIDKGDFLSESRSLYGKDNFLIKKSLIQMNTLKSKFSSLFKFSSSSSQKSMESLQHLSKDELKKRLTPLQYNVTQNNGTEPPYRNEYNSEVAPGVYKCLICKIPLFTSDYKYNSGCGWPAFSDEIKEAKIVKKKDFSHGMVRTEVRCSQCDSHLGHLFEDGPMDKTGIRYCINSASLDFEKDNTKNGKL